jgi:hypothetical protein
MAGSKRDFLYTSDRGVSFAVELDESNVEEVNVGLTAAQLVPVVGTLKLPIASKLRFAVYRSADGRVSRQVPVLTTGALASIPTSLVVPVTGAPGTAPVNVTLTLSTTRGEKFAYVRGDDSGLNDGDNPG